MSINVNICLSVVLMMLFGQGYGQSSTCCYFDDSLCQWAPTAENGWQWAKTNKPDTDDVPSFSADSNYIYIQNETATISSQELAVDSSTVLSFSYFSYIETPGVSDSLNFYFKQNNRTNRRSFELVQSSSGDWVNFHFVCETWSVCCDVFPCSGHIEIVGKSGSSDNFFAVDNFQVDDQCKYITTTTPAPSTTPAPTTTTLAPNTTTPAPNTNATAPTTPASITTTMTPTNTTRPPNTTTASTTTTKPEDICCTFDDSVCGWGVSVSNSWYWSKDQTPDWSKIPEFSHDSEYLWTQNTNFATLLSSKITDVQGDTVFSFDYYGYIGGRIGFNSLLVYFRENGQPDHVLLDTLTDTNLQWTSPSVDCTSHGSCCDNYPCEGQIELVASVTYENALFAFDNAAVDNGCGTQKLTWVH